MLDPGLIDLVTRLTRQESRVELCEARLRALEGAADQATVNHEQTNRQLDDLRRQLDDLREKA